MTYQLSIDQMLDVLNEIDPTGNNTDFKLFRDMVETVATNLARAVAYRLGIECGEASFEGVAFAGTCVPFYPKAPDQALPEVFVMLDFDRASEWGR